MLLALLLAFAAAASAQPAAPEAPATRGGGEWTPVTQRTLQRFTSAVGSLRANQRARLAAQVSSRVEKVLVEIGDIVHNGQELVRLDSQPFDIEVAQRKAGLQGARVARDDAQRNFDAAKELFERPEGMAAISQQQFDGSKANLDLASARLAEAEAGLRAAEFRLKESHVRAPFNAIVTQRMVDAGDLVTSAPVTPLLEVQDVETLLLEFSLPQEMLASVHKGTPVSYEVSGASAARAAGTVQIVYPAIDEATRSFRCRVAVSNKDFRYRPGQLVQVRVLEREVPNALAVPRTALQQTANGWRVTVEADGKPQARPVKVGLLTEDAAEITQGLSAGQRVWISSRR